MDKKTLLEVGKHVQFPDENDFKYMVRNYSDSLELSWLYSQVLSDVYRQFFYDCDACNSHPDPHLSRKRIKEKILKQVPQLSLFLKNIHPGASYQVDAMSILRGTGVNFSNISDFKRDLRAWHDLRWTRDYIESKGNNEAQGSVSVLGSISEELLKRAISNLSSDTGERSDCPQIFQTTQDDTKSYGDFVLMSLPNNLWFSVKSGFSRERLLASGFSNDLVGVGFFEDPSEFTSLPKIRNFKKAGFLAIYLPDVAVTEQQSILKTSTYEEVVRYYTELGKNLPLNINGTPFFRALSKLGGDINKLLESPLQKRSTLSF